MPHIVQHDKLYFSYSPNRATTSGALAVARLYLAIHMGNYTTLIALIQNKTHPSTYPNL